MPCIKMTTAEIKAYQNEKKSGYRIPVTVVAENIRSVYNVGSIFRTCDAASVEKLILSGYTAYPPRKDLEKTALGSTRSVSWERHENTELYLGHMRNMGSSIVVFEHAHGMRNIFEARITFPVCAVFGNEVSGVTDDIVSMADSVMYVPMGGIKESLNVSVACGIVLYELLRRYVYGISDCRFRQSLLKNFD